MRIGETIIVNNEKRIYIGKSPEGCALYMINKNLPDSISFQEALNYVEREQGYYPEGIFRLLESKDLGLIPKCIIKKNLFWLGDKLNVDNKAFIYHWGEPHQIYTTCHLPCAYFILEEKL